MVGLIYHSTYIPAFTYTINMHNIFNSFTFLRIPLTYSIISHITSHTYTSHPGCQGSTIIQRQSTPHVHLAVDDWVSVSDVNSFQNCQLFLFRTFSYDASVVDHHATCECFIMVQSDVSFRSAVLQVHGNPTRQGCGGVANI